jgi:general secretion pathway protein D
MIRPNYLRAFAGHSWIAASLLCCFALSAGGRAGWAQTSAADGTGAVRAQQAPAGPSIETSPAGVVGTVGHPIESTPHKRQARDAEAAYLAGAKKLEHDDLDAAETQFQRALKLDPGNRSYAIAISVTRQHRLTELVHRATQARQTGDAAKAETLLAEARAIDPESPMVIEHSGPFVMGAQAARAAGLGASLSDRGQMIAAASADTPWKVQGPVLAGAIRLAPEEGLKSHHVNGSASEVIRNVALAYGINAIVDDSVEQKALRFNLENVDYQRAMSVVMSMTHAFISPVDEKTVMVAKDDSANRQRLERQLQETIYVPGLTTEQINELAQVVKAVFDVKQSSIQMGLGSILVRAPQEVLEPLNLILKDLIDGSGEVMVEVKLYEVDSTRMTDAGGALPTQFSVFNVDQAANAIVNANQALVQQGIAQGLITPGTSNLVIALALIKLGLVQSSLATNLIGVIGGGITQTGISAATNVTFNLNLNSSDTRSLDDVQLRVGDREPATFREGNRYPITSSTFTSGISTAASSALGNQTINGVSVSSLLNQFAGGSSAIIPQVTYEDLGVTLKATPVIEKSGRINLLLDLKIEALAGSSLDGNPVLESRQFASDLTVADGESALMVSNLTRSESAAMTGLPGLSELPGFQLPIEEVGQRSSNQLVVVVTPHIVRRRSDLIAGPRIPTRALADN